MSSFSIRRKRPMEAFRALPVFVAVTLAMPLLVSAAERDQDSETATRPEYGLKLNAARRLDENAPSEEGDAPTYLTAFKMIGTPNEKIELIDSAEVRRGGSVLRGDTITYTITIPKQEVRRPPLHPCDQTPTLRSVF